MQRADPARAPRPRKPRPRREIGPRPHRGDALTHRPILGAIIAGGRATRFGSDKGAALLGGVALIDHAGAAIRPYVDTVVVVGRAWQGLQCVADLPAAGLGPLGGIAGALAHAEATGHDRVLTIGCDMPTVPAALLIELIERAPAFCIDAPILGVWPAALSTVLIAGLDGEDRSVRRWARMIGAAPIAAPRPLANINMPADLMA